VTALRGIGGLRRTAAAALGVRARRPSMMAALLAATFAVSGSKPLCPPREDSPYVRQIKITGNNRTRERALLREMRLRPGETTCEPAERSDEKRLLDLGLFSNVEIKTEAVSPESVDVLVHVRERPTFLPIPELGYSAEDGTTFGLTIRESNFLGDAQRIGASALFGGRESLSISWSLPWFGYLHMGLFASAYDTQWEDRIEHLRERRHGVRAGLNRYFDGYRYSLGVDAKVEDIDSDPTAAADSSDVARHDTERMLAVGAGYDTRDFRTNPHNGFAVAARYEQYGSWLGGDVTMNRTSLSAAVFVPAAETVTLALGVQGAFSGGSIPDYERLRLGGNETVRGFSEGHETGESRAWGTVELRFPVFKKRTFELPILDNFDISGDGAVFGDLGVIWERSGASDAGLMAGIGVGIRLFMPLAGVSRTDVALGSERRLLVRGSGRMKF